jgi:hypothetical protein
LAAATMLRYRGNLLVVNLDGLSEDASRILQKHLGMLHFTT